MKRIKIFSVLASVAILGIILLSFISSCSGGKNADARKADSAAGNFLPLPFVPDSLKTPEERAAYVALHYWDGMKFDNELIIRDTLFIEQSFVDFASMLPIAQREESEKAVELLMQRASVSREAFDIFCFTAEKYLDSPDSPMRDGESYILFLEQIVKSPLLSDDEKLAPRHNLEMALKNRVGTQATDFRFTDRNGTSSSLFTSGSDYSVVIFYNPDCDHCRQTIAEFETNPMIRAAVEANTLSVIAIDIDGDKNKWEASKASLPATWTVGLDQSHIEDNELYALPDLPVIYLLDSAKNILLKETSLHDILSFEF